MGIIADALKPDKVIVQCLIVHCQICGRQIVSYQANTSRYIGPASDGCLCLVHGYACPSCTKDEQALEAAGYYN